MADDLSEKALEAVEVAKATGKIKKGSNECTKALEKGNAKLVVVAKDVSPPEITMHMPLLAKEKDVDAKGILKEIADATGKAKE